MSGTFQNDVTVLVRCERGGQQRGREELTWLLENG